MDETTDQPEEINEQEDNENTEEKQVPNDSEQNFTEDNNKSIKNEDAPEISKDAKNDKNSEDETGERRNTDGQDVITEKDEHMKQDKQERDIPPSYEHEKLERDEIMLDEKQNNESEIQELKITKTQSEVFEYEGEDMEYEGEEIEYEGEDIQYEGEDIEYEGEETEYEETEADAGNGIEEIYVQSFYRKREEDDDNFSEKQFNIFGQLRASQLGPVVTLGSMGSEDGEGAEGRDEDSFYKMSIMQTDLTGVQPVIKYIDRDAYIEEYRNLSINRGNLRRKNGYLNRKMAEFYIKRKMDRVFHDVTSDYEELLLRYERKIDELCELREDSETKKNVVQNEIEELRTERDEYKVELNNILREMLDREREISLGLIDTKTGKAISEKVVEKYIQRQYSKIEQIATVRFNYLKRRERIREVENKVKALETIDGTLHLMDFEQIRMDNQMTSDKLEEREAELLKLRNRYAGDVLAIAHTREKTAVVENQIADLNDDYVSVENELAEIREELNKLKTERDANRNQTIKLKEASGLLPYTNLLIDFEECINLADKYKQEIEALKNLYREIHRKIIAIKFTIENTEPTNDDCLDETLMFIKQRPHFYRNKPILSFPVLPKITHIQQSAQI